MAEGGPLAAGMKGEPLWAGIKRPLRLRRSCVIESGIFFGKLLFFFSVVRPFCAVSVVRGI